MARTQLRLDAMSGSYSSAEINQLADTKSALTSSYASTDMNGVMSDMASAIRRIHGADFASQGAGVFSHAITGSAGLKVAGDIDANGTSDFAGAMVLQAGITIAGVSKLDGAVDANSTSNFQGAMVLQSTLDVDGALDVDGVATLASAVIEGAASVGTTLGVTGAATLSSTLGVTGAATLSSTLGVTGAATLSSTLGVTGATTLSSTVAAAGTVSIGGGYGSTGITLSDAGVLQMNGALTVDGAATLSSTVAAAGTVSIGGGYGSTGITLSDAGVLQMNGALTVDGAASVGGNLTVTGDLVVNGNTTTINVSELLVEDKHIVVGYALSGITDVTADGGGIILTGSTNHTMLWVDSTDAWTFSEHLFPSTNNAKDLGSSTFKWKDLQLGGNASVGGTLGVTGVSSLAAITGSAGLRVNGDSTLASLSVTNAASVGGTLGVTGVSSLAAITGSAGLRINGDSTLASLSVTNAAAVGGTLGVTGVSTFTGAITGSAGLKLAGDGDFNGAVAFAGTFVLDSSSPQVISKTGGDLVIKTSADLYFHDQYRAASTWSSLDGVKLAATAAEWSAFETAAGSEASILGALGMALAGSGGGKGKFSEVIATDAANGQVTFSPSPLFTGISDQAGRIDVYLNGQMMSADDYALSGAAVVDFVFGLKVDDVVTVVIR